ncbi:hypothetical protein NUW54_g7846 [Trametes sanguinea]|uniref:Uncharacterized protein n=1 Tax=Trametes sanguinea TaxID=158606 RepID=A0ACC1PJG5_9APHY|nr:hypothetical protein NUW54_g7846 [Trametes sanguinea]
MPPSTAGSQSASPPPSPPAPAPKSPKGTVFWLSFTAVVVCNFLSALDVTAVSTALPTITAELNGGGQSSPGPGSASASASAHPFPPTPGVMDESRNERGLASPMLRRDSEGQPRS